MKLAKSLVLPGILVAAFVCAVSQTPRQSMARWTGRYPDAKFFNQPQIRAPLRRILPKADYDSVSYYNLMVPIKRVGDYLVTYASIKYSDPLESMSLAFGLKDNSVYVVFQKGEEHRKSSTKNNDFNLPDEVLEELGLKEAQ